MNLNDYQTSSRVTARYLEPAKNALGEKGGLLYTVLGLSSEAGEVADKVKKLLRDKSGVLDDATRHDILMELGDALWYVGGVAFELGATLEEVAAMNLEKLNSRKDRGTLHGSGDNR